MNAYLVRLKINAKLVGLFVAPSANSLWDYIDEWRDPEDCEYRKLRDGGIHLECATAPRIPTIWSEDDPEESPDWFARASLSELWIPIFNFKDGEQGWKDVVIPDASI